MDTNQPTGEELECAMWVAHYAREVCEALIETGHPSAEPFMKLCAKIDELKGMVSGDFFERAEDLHDWNNTHQMG